ncbi:PRD domain-containing protein, partial [Ruminococcaceae bacterium OttesenSCG-928-D13]|nr:PRD domain-containing protein [Ruminococcaceae bacterium OttesenSCG-928-D13]
MRIKKILNHNIVVAIDDKNRECVLTGKGIAFGKKAGETLDMALVEKKFTTKEKGTADKLSRILEAIPPEYIRVGDEVINMAKAELSQPLSEKIYLTLIDHIYFAVDRHKDGVDITNSLAWEMQQFYLEEYSVGIKALDIIEKRMGVRPPDDEAAYIAFHLVNAGSSSGRTYIPIQDSLKMIRDILEIVERELDVTFDKSTHNYNRFVNHLKFFSLRVFEFGNGANASEVKLDASNPIFRLRYE